MGHSITSNAIAFEAARIRVVHGANDGVFGLAGTMVSTVRLSLVDAFNIPNDAQSLVNGVQVDDNYVLQSNDVLEMSFQHGAFAAIEFPVGSGQMQKHDVDGHVGIVGKVFYKDGTTQTIFQRFVSHPFWQYSHRSSN